MPEYLCYFAQIHENFRLPELQALSDLFGADLAYHSDEYSDTVSEYTMMICRCPFSIPFFRVPS
jgi:tRNA G10  N-methylase Trm11